MGEGTREVSERVAAMLAARISRSTRERTLVVR
jgi:hypothetical protein